MVETAKEVGVYVYDPHVVTVVGIASRSVVVQEWFWCSTLPWFPSLTPSIHKKYTDPWICEMNKSCFHLLGMFLIGQCCEISLNYRLHAKFRISKTSQSGMYRGNGNKKNTCDYSDPTPCHYLKHKLLKITSISFNADQNRF